MKELKIETGKKEYNLGGKVTVEFSPTDMDFVERVINVLQKAEEKQKETESELKGADLTMALTSFGAALWPSIPTSSAGGSRCSFCSLPSM